MQTKKPAAITATDFSFCDLPVLPDEENSVSANGLSDYSWGALKKRKIMKQKLTRGMNIRRDSSLLMPALARRRQVAAMNRTVKMILIAQTLPMLIESIAACIASGVCACFMASIGIRLREAPHPRMPIAITERK
ncbi:hypothetical protein [Succinimonas sp.]|uniref:hypothetical protein n=1 Tax=Succinimonas sp. TaxID=1936151 RepID=UPI00386C158B